MLGWRSWRSLQHGRITFRQAQLAGLQEPPHDLAATSTREHGEKSDLLRRHGGPESLARVAEQFQTQRIGGFVQGTPVRDLLSGNSIVDLCTDEMVNYGGLLGQLTLFNSAYVSTPFSHSGKHVLKASGGGVASSVVPKLLFIAMSDVGKVDVFEIQSGLRVATLDVPGVRVVASYWRQ